MSRFMSHREMKAASRVIGEYKYRTQLLEKVVEKLLEREDLRVVVNEETEEIELLTPAQIAERAQAAEAQSKKDFEIREIPDEEAA